jgi:hypothetical protein
MRSATRDTLETNLTKYEYVITVLYFKIGHEMSIVGLKMPRAPHMVIFHQRFGLTMGVKQGATHLVKISNGCVYLHLTKFEISEVYHTRTMWHVHFNTFLCKIFYKKMGVALRRIRSCLTSWESIMAIKYFKLGRIKQHFLFIIWFSKGERNVSLLAKSPISRKSGHEQVCAFFQAKQRQPNSTHLPSRLSSAVPFPL